MKGVGMSELTTLNTDVNREIDKDPFAADCVHLQRHCSVMSIACVPTVEGGACNAQHSQGLLGRQVRSLHQPMISSFSEAGYLIRVPPIPEHVFFEQPQFQRWLGDNFLEISGFTPKRRDVTGVRLANNVPGQALLAGFHEVLGPFEYRL